MATILSEQHDVNSINVEIPDFERNLRDGIDRINNGGGWDEAEYGISRAAAIARLQAADTPEAREKVVKDLIQRAIARFGVDQANGKLLVMVAGEAAWHKLGINISEAANTAEAFKLFPEFGFQVDGWKLEAIGPNGERVAVPDRVANIRLDTNGYLGTVGNWYRPFQQKELAEFADAVSASGGVKWETMGVVKGGRQVWLLGNMNSIVEIVPGDEVKGYALFSNWHDGSGALKVLSTNERTVCRNTLNRALRGGRGGALSILHSQNLKAKVEAAKLHLGVLKSDMETFKEEAQALAKVQLNSRSVRDYFQTFYPTEVKPAQVSGTDGAALLDAVLAQTEGRRVTEELLAAKQERNVLEDLMDKHYADTERIAEKNRKIVEQLLENFESGLNRLPGMEGSAWAAVNSVTQLVDHQLGTSNAKLQSAAFGAGSELKQRAFETALALATR